MRTINLIHRKLIYYISLKKKFLWNYNICDYSINLKDVKFIANMETTKQKLNIKKIFPNNPKFILDTKNFLMILIY